jgi:hypothetical protein
MIGTVERAARPDDLAEIPDGTPLAEIAVRNGVTVAVARRWVTAEGLPPVTRRPGALRPTSGPTRGRYRIAQVMTGPREKCWSRVR